MINTPFIPYDAFNRVLEADCQKNQKLSIVSDMCRVNTLSAIKRAGSGHLGSSLSSMEIFVLLYFDEMNTLSVGLDHPDRDIFFSSKGHDAPGQYAVLMAAGVLSLEQLSKLRRLGGLEGHPERTTCGIEASCGSLGMGISKGKGIAFAKRLGGHGGRVIVLTGDGELQEGQNWEALQNAVHQGLSNIHVLVDANSLQTDKPLKEIIALKNLEEKLTAFGWYVERCNGHDLGALKKVFEKFRTVHDKPKILIADTIKGKGISFMEHPNMEGDIYRWHSGAPDDGAFIKGYEELLLKVSRAVKVLGIKEIGLEIPENALPKPYALSNEKIVQAYEQALVEIGSKRKEIVVLDGDLSADCGLRSFEQAFPERFIENGIAEQDMVSMAGGLALQGYLPIVHSFSSFLSARANEQIFNNATEGTKIIYVCNYAGLLPAGPGNSHQGIRDLSLFGAIPNCIAMEPCNGEETKSLLSWAVETAKENCLLRLSIFPSPSPIDLPGVSSPALGKGVVLKEGHDAVLFAYGPVMLHEALSASHLLEGEVSLKVVNMPWLNRIDPAWIEEVVGASLSVFVMDNHAFFGGLGDSLLNTFNQSDTLRGKLFRKFAVEGSPACGAPAEVLRFHGLDAEGLALKVKGVFDSHGERIPRLL